MSHTIEVELRYQVTDVEVFKKKLLEQEAVFVRSEHIIDHWYIPHTIQNAEEQHEWFNVERGWSLRIREIEQEDGSMKTLVGSKRVVADDGHKGLAEAECEIESFSAAEPLIALMDRKEFLTIDKKRAVYTCGNFEIVIDDIKGYGVGTEIEMKTEMDKGEALQQIEAYAQTLGLTKDDEHELSITVSAMKDLAQYA